jgi:hypothetical protein
MHSLSQEPEGKRILERPRHRWKDNIKMNIKGIAFEDMDCIYLAQDRVKWHAVVGTVMNYRFHKCINDGNFLTR